MFNLNIHPQWIIAGLGNSEAKYINTRHNAGYLCIDTFAQKHGVEINTFKFDSMISQMELNGQQCILIKPVTGMNESGKAILNCANHYKISSEKILVIHDDISFGTGVIRIRRKGSAGGHNGLKSIISYLNCETFSRIKLGVGQKPHKKYNLANWVLAKMDKSELEALQQACIMACDAIELIVQGEIDTAMSKYNHKNFNIKKNNNW